MNKVYLGNNYIADKSPLTSSDVANITSALLGLDASSKVFDASIKALDASALAFDSSIRELAQGGGGGGVTPAQLDASLREYTYDKAHIDASFGEVDASIQGLDASVRASASASRIIAALGRSNVEGRTDTKYEATSEFGKYPKNLFYDGGDPNVVLHVGCGLDEEDREDAIQIFDNGNIIFLDINRNQRSLQRLQRQADSHDASIQALDASALAFDASIKELAQGGGGGGDKTRLSQFTNDMDFRSITYTDVSTYNSLIDAGTVDPSVMYILTDAADEVDISTFVSKNDISIYAERSDLDDFILIDDLSIYAKSSDMTGYITQAEAGQIVESHYSTYISSFNQMSSDYQDVSAKLGDMESILNQILGE